jgi:hypothetical protein
MNKPLSAKNVSLSVISSPLADESSAKNRKIVNSNSVENEHEFKQQIRKFKISVAIILSVNLTNYNVKKTIIFKYYVKFPFLNNSKYVIKMIIHEIFFLI